MRRILFVDDQSEVLDAHRKSLRKYDGQVETSFALGGEAALDIVRGGALDAVVADLHMPGIDGPTLLKRLKEDCPGIIRIILCHQHEVDSIFAALPAAHQVLAKPLDADLLMNAVERTCRLRDLLTDSLRSKIGGVEQLPSIPTIYTELSAAMANPNVTNLKLARVIEKDPPMAAKTLQLVNSACFGLLRNVTSLESAIAFLGMDLIRDLSLTVHIFASLEGAALRARFSFDDGQQHSLLTAKVAKRLVAGRRQAQNAFTAGLLHDIGKLVLAVCIPDKFVKVQRVCNATGRSSHEIEAEMLGVTHAEVGAYLLGLWGLPYPVLEAVAYHHNPAAALERNVDVPTAVAVATGLVEEITINRPFAIADHLKALGVIDELPEWTAIARQEAKGVLPEKMPEKVTVQ